jgi:hypothetical protein
MYTTEISLSEISLSEISLSKISLSKISLLLNEATHILHETIYKIKNNIELLDYNEKLDLIISELTDIIILELRGTQIIYLEALTTMIRVYKIKKYLQYMSNKYQKPKFTLEDDVNIN